MSLGTWLITIALKKLTNHFPWKQAKEDNSRRKFMMIFNKLSIHHDVYAHGMNKFLKETLVFNESHRCSLLKNLSSVFLSSSGEVPCVARSCNVQWTCHMCYIENITLLGISLFTLVSVMSDIIQEMTK